ncbi:MAG: iron uptake porin [Cyanobacteria bacterium P01_F01_bin.86]
MVAHNVPIAFVGGLALGVGVPALLPEIVRSQEIDSQSLAQVTSVSELSDVQPTDWWFGALQSLVERYGCIAGYPDATFRGQRAMTRGEFAAGLNACLDRINELIAAGLADKVSREDLTTVQRLQEEFAAELAALTGRTDALEATTAELEANPLGLNSATSKLSFELLTGIFAASEPGDVTNNAFVPYELLIGFDASFTGEDHFRVTLEADEVQPFSGDPVGLFLGPDDGDDGELITLEDTFYNFPLFNGRVSATFGLNDITPGDTFVFSIPFAALSDFVDLPDVVYDGTGDTTLAFTWEAVEDLVFISYGYGADEAEGNTFGSGLFAGPSIHAIELAFTPAETLTFAAAGALVAGGQADSDPGDDFSAVSVGLTWEINPFVILSGWYAHSFIEDDGVSDTDDFLIGLAFPDLFIEGADAGALIGSPDSAVAAIAEDDDFDFPFYAEVYYTFPVTDIISVTPGIYYISNADGDDDIIVGGVQTGFSF